jgi:hypothetical protein
MAKKKLREWEIPMNLSKEERILYKMTVEDQIANSAKKVTKKVAS